MTAPAHDRPPAAASVPGTATIAIQELRDLWLGGRAPALTFAFSVVLSVIAYLTATNEELNFLEQRESVNLTLQAAIAVGALLALLCAADAISGERERGTLESLMLTPVSRADITSGKLLAAISVWLAALAVSVPYVWYLGRGIDLVTQAIAAGVVVGTLLAVFVAGLGILISVFVASNRISLSLAVFLLLALYAPTQLPTTATRGWVGDLLVRANPITAGEHYVGRLIVNGHGWRDDASWLLSPILAAALFAVAAALAGRFIGLRGGGRTG